MSIGGDGDLSIGYSLTSESGSIVLADPPFSTSTAPFPCSTIEATPNDFYVLCFGVDLNLSEPVEIGPRFDTNGVRDLMFAAAQSGDDRNVYVPEPSDSRWFSIWIGFLCLRFTQRGRRMTAEPQLVG